jgi:hypothetical protein
VGRADRVVGLEFAEREIMVIDYFETNEHDRKYARALGALRARISPLKAACLDLASRKDELLQYN